VWSPKANADGRRNVTYDNLAKCQGGDVVFSYANGKISQIALVETAAETAQKPLEFGSAGDNWNQEGWLVRVNWQPLRQPMVPQTYFELIQPLLSERHSPISTSSGRGNQGVYLAGLGEALGQGLFRGRSCRSAMKFSGYMAQQMHLGLIRAGGSAAGRAGRGWAGR